MFGPIMFLPKKQIYTRIDERSMHWSFPIKNIYIQTKDVIKNYFNTDIVIVVIRKLIFDRFFLNLINDFTIKKQRI